MQRPTSILASLLLAVPVGAQAPTRAAAVPDPLAAPGDRSAMTLQATGVQIYECRADPKGGPATWAFREPLAELFLDGRRIGRHRAGPTWEHEDGSAVTGRVVARVDAPTAGDIPWLRLDVVARRGAGAFADLAAILRVNTRGGTLSGPCREAGRVSEVPYTSDYVMLRDS